jgi:hypothetical protein
VAYGRVGVSAMARLSREAAAHDSPAAAGRSPRYAFSKERSTEGCVLIVDLIGGLRCQAARRDTYICYPSADTKAKRFAPRTTGIRTASPIKT